MQIVLTPHKLGTAKPWVLAPLPNTVELGENGRKTVTKTVPSTVRRTVLHRLPLKPVPLRVQMLTLTTFKVIFITPINFYLYDTGTTKYVLVIALYTTLAFHETHMLKISRMATV